MGRVKGQPDYSPEIKIEAVQCYLRQFPESVCDEAKRKKCLPRNDRVRNSDGLTKFDSAHEDVKRRAFVDPDDSKRVKTMTTRQFRNVVRIHGKGVLVKGQQYSRTRKRADGPLSHAELPTLQDVSAKEFPHLPQPEAYNQLKRDLDWDDEEFGQCFLLGMDQDRRHSWTDFRKCRADRQNKGTGRKRDRRDIEYGQGDSIQFQDRQLISTAPRVPDCIKQPVECCIGWIKREAAKKYRNKKNVKFQDMRDAVETACKELNEKGISNYWNHATKSLAVFAATKNQRVKVAVRNKERTFLGVHGGWVSKHLRG